MITRRASDGRSEPKLNPARWLWEGYVSFGFHPVTGKRVRKHYSAQTKAEAFAKLRTLERIRDDGDIATVAAHELGHTLGLRHPPDGLNCTTDNPRPSIMYQSTVKFVECPQPRRRDVDNVNLLYW
jgi:hypothetical protein